MRRRTFLAALPAAAVAGPALRHQPGREPEPRPAGRACRRPHRRGDLRLALRGLGPARRGGHRPSAGDAGGHRHPEGRRLGGGRGDRDQRRAGLRRADRLRHRRRLLRHAVGPEDEEGGGPERLGPQPRRSASRPRARAPEERRTSPPYGAISVSVPGAVDAWWSLHQRYGKLPWKDLLRSRRSATAEEGAPIVQNVAFYVEGSNRNFTKPGAGIEEIDNFKQVWAPRRQDARARARSSATRSSPAPTA